MPNPGPPPPDIAHLNPASHEFRHRQWLGPRLRPSHDSDSHPGLAVSRPDLYASPYCTVHDEGHSRYAHFSFHFSYLTHWVFFDFVNPQADLAGILCRRRSSSYLSEKADGLISVPPRCLKVPVVQRLFSRTPRTTVCIFAPHFLCIEGEDSPPAQRIYIIFHLLLYGVLHNGITRAYRHLRRASPYLRVQNSRPFMCEKSTPPVQLVTFPRRR
ncbi:hypothetical protein K438DRAFT_682560 [Mycena galopus ATCC 62051]|nr:hypothetical protein K438DRAFT_682560 [Mycena galopus ATCC 62051]